MDTYEQKYKEALEKLRDFYRDYDTVSCLIDVKEELANLFPELKESEYERIKKTLINFFSKGAEYDSSTNGIKDRNIIAWLEKQGEQKPFDYENADIQQKDFAPKETVKEAESNLTPLERKVKDILFSFHINADDGISFDGTMAIVHNLITLCQQEQKPAWSEKDEKEYKYVLKFVDNILNNCGNKKDYDHCKRCYDWLKSLRPQPKQEWSEEDEKIFVNLISYGSLKYTGEQVIEWLNSLKQRIGGK